ncbi:hypothetical protein DID74_01095 [Candidatus Marinamargulisbacteria bacterium SCGC AG-333-B06]|nr:hypothetical protein DID74_01095 [Candidatus Marinamargulisbacteria bacterium SCGC AG-333-B06]
MIRIFSLFFILMFPVFILGTTIHDQLAKIDKLYETRDQDNHIKRSLYLIDSSKEYITTKRHDYALLWRYARSASRTPDYLIASKKTKLEFLSKGVGLGKKAIELYPNKTEGHYWYAIALGRQAELKGILKSLSSIKPIKETMDTILALDANFHRAHFVLSRLYRKAPRGISIGNPKKALEHINIALSMDPKESMYILEKARVLVKLKKQAKARSLIREFLKLPYDSNYFKDQVDRDKVEAQKLLSKIT